jgi:hypothetical protein
MLHHDRPTAIDRPRSAETKSTESRHLRGGRPTPNRIRTGDLLGESSQRPTADPNGIELDPLSGFRRRNRPTFRPGLNTVRAADAEAEALGLPSRWQRHCEVGGWWSPRKLVSRESAVIV